VGDLTLRIYPIKNDDREWFNEYVGWGFIVIGVITGVGLLIRYLAETKVNYYFNKQLDQHKHNLDIITKNIEYGISKKLYDFEAYASKKHTVYPELYSLTFGFWQEISRFRSRFDRDIKFSKNDMNKETLEQHFYEKIQPLVEKIPKVYDYFYKNELYLSKATAEVYEKAMHAQIYFIDKIIDSFNSNLENSNWQDSSFSLIKIKEEDYDKVDDKIYLLKEIIYKELSYTHSEEI
jgi:uncharacterized membrane-anchored protein YhcB (DUF1043 family)